MNRQQEDNKCKTRIISQQKTMENLLLVNTKTIKPLADLRQTPRGISSFPPNRKLSGNVRCMAHKRSAKGIEFRIIRFNRFLEKQEILKVIREKSIWVALNEFGRCIEQVSIEDFYHQLPSGIPHHYDSGEVLEDPFQQGTLQQPTAWR